jgi:glycosyltransferase involved in cell wall biosynthesis
MSPPVSIVVRSYRRPGPLLELVERLRAQTHREFELVIVEQSEDPALVARLEALGDPRIRILVRPPLGAPGARNEGVRHASGEILLFIDDDDLPTDEEWVGAHVANYDDPDCMGVNGRLSSDPTGASRVRFPRLVRWASFRYSFFRDPLTLAVGPLRKPGITFLVGNNFSVRRSLVERVGGWDEGVPMGEELSFFFRYARVRGPREYLVYDPAPVIWRRVDVPGGLDRRTRDDWYVNELRGRVIFYHGIVARYFPARFRAFYPLFWLRPLQQVLMWIWDADNRGRGTPQRLRATIDLLRRFPALAAKFRREAQGVRPVERLLDDPPAAL